MSAIPTKSRPDSEELNSNGPESVVVRTAVRPDESDWLDREHQERVSRVERCDTKEGRKAAAKDALGLLTEENQELQALRNAQGGDEHVEACRRCRWFPYQAGLVLGSRLAWMLDAVLWLALWGGLWWLWVRYYEDGGEGTPGWLYLPGALAVPFLALLSARVAKGFGEHVAVTRVTNPDSVDETIDRQVRFAGKGAVAAGVFLLGLLALLFFSPPSWSGWVTYVSSLVGFGANIALGLSAGVGGNAARLLAKPAERDSLDCQIDMKDRTRRYLRRFILVLFLCVGVLLPPVGFAEATDAVWVWAIDTTSSVDPGQREDGVDAMITVAFERARALGVRAIQIIKFSNEVLLADMSWVTVPTDPLREDCTKAVAGPLLSKSLVGLSPSVASGRRDEAVATCTARQEAVLRAFDEKLARFREQLKLATRVTPRSDVSTRLVPLLKKLVERPYVAAIDVVTDGIDNSGLALSTVKASEKTPVLLIIARPDPRRRTPTLDEVLRAADAWGRVGGITVTSVSEYRGLVVLSAGRW